MKGLYSSPLRVYLAMGLLALVGILQGFQLPISLYPNSNKPTIWVNISYGSLTGQEFIRSYGDRIESELRALSTTELEVEKLTSEYQKSRVYYKVEFDWGADPKVAKNEVSTLLNGQSARWPREVRDSLNVSFWSKSSGFIAISFFSDSRSLDEIFDVLDPIFAPQLAKVDDAEGAALWNPSQQEISITLIPEALAKFSLFPKNVEDALRMAMQSMNGGTLNIGQGKLSIEMPKNIKDMKTLEEVLIPLQDGRFVHLKEVALLDLGPSTESSRIFKTDGAKSLILFANPRTGGNVKRMAEDILKIVKDSENDYPQDIQYKVLVDPSEFIRASVKNVFKEVVLAATLAVLVLFLFIGSLRNTITAALEIPLSMILAFILMKISGMNLNLISLGGLALAAGMNVDASVVVMENIFRHLEAHPGILTFKEKLKIMTTAVREVALPIIASTISTLVVFVPLIFTRDLTYAVLGDLAKAVVFSHGFSMFIALILVPTIRLQMMKGQESFKTSKSPMEGVLTRLENAHQSILNFFIERKTVRIVTMATIVSLCLGGLFFVLPKLPKEIIGTPDTDWMILSVNTQGNTLMKQMEDKTSEVEARFREKFDEYIKYTFVQIQRPNSGTIMGRLKDKHDMEKVWKMMDEEFQNEPSLYFWVGPWNPAELPLPDPPHLDLSIKGSNPKEAQIAAEVLRDDLKEVEAFPRIWSEPSVDRQEFISVEPYAEQWSLLSMQGTRLSAFNIVDYLRVATDGKHLEKISFDGKEYGVKMKLDRGKINSLEDLGSLPINVKGEFIPLSAITEISRREQPPQIYRIDGKDVIKLYGKQKKGQEKLIDGSLAKVKAIVEKFKEKDLTAFGVSKLPSVTFEDAQKELNKALKQLAIALGISILLIFFTLIFQFGNLIETFIILTAVPFAIVGGGLSLFIFGSTLSLNSVLGIILLNGIAVNNSIILVDFIRKSFNAGMSPRVAALTAAKKRLRPILITTLTTILGMLPVALGTGDGGKILQPLGLSVAGGLWFSTFFTLFFVPLFEWLYLERVKRIDFEKTDEPPRSDIPRERPLGEEGPQAWQ